jgi:TolA-binding protein
MNSKSTRHRSIKRPLAFLALGLVLCAAAPAVADQIAGLAERLSSLRADVEDLSATLARKNSDIRDQLRSLSRQKTELELELKKEQTRVQKVQLSINQRRAKVTEEQGHDAELEPLFGKTASEVRAYVQGTLPFRIEERLAEIAKIEDQHKQGLLSTSKALSRLWTFVEDEFRLTRESGVYKQTITVDGHEHLAEVVRLGMVMLYFKTGDTTVGQAVRDTDAWKFEVIDDLDKKKHVEQLFDSFHKQLRVGYVTLPAALGKVVEAAPPKPPPAAAADSDGEAQ